MAHPAQHQSHRQIGNFVPDTRSAYPPMISFDAAMRIISEQAKALPAESVPLEQAAFRASSQFEVRNALARQQSIRKPSVRSLQRVDKPGIPDVVRGIVMAEIEPGPDTPRWRAVIRYLTDNGSLRHKPPATSGPGQPQRRGTPLLRCRGALILCLTEEEMAMSDQRGVRLTGRDERGRNWGATIWGPDPQEGETLKLSLIHI